MKEHEGIPRRGGRFRFDRPWAPDYRPDAVMGSGIRCAWLGLWLGVALLTTSVGNVRAQDVDEAPPSLAPPASDDDERPGDSSPRQPTEPLRVVAALGGGFTVRLVKNLEFQQERFAPSYLDAFGGVVLPGSGLLRHQLTLQLSVNLSGDGNYTFGLDPLEQWTFMPAYTLRFQPQRIAVPDYFAYGRVGIPLTVSPDFTWGVEVDAGFTYMLLAGLGIYAEVGYSMFFGGKDRSGSTSIHPLLSAELGVIFDIEVL